MSTPRDDIARRLGLPGRRDPLAAAIRLESAMDAMHQRAQADGPPADWQPYREDGSGLAFCCQRGAEDYPSPCPVHGAQAVDDSTDLERAAAAVQLAPSTLTAAEFSRLVDPLQPADVPPPADVVVPPELLAGVTPPVPGTDWPAEDPAGSLRQLVDEAVRRQVDADLTHAWATPPVSSVPPAPFISERGRVLDWRSRHDPRSRDYGVTEHRLAGRAPLQDVLLDRGPVLDQGAEGACAGFAAVDVANSMELAGWHRRGYEGQPADLLDADDALTLYERAKELDDVPGEDYSGTSILAAMKAGQEQGHWAGYLWAFGVRDIAQTLLQLRQAVVIGVPWGSLMATAPGGLVTIGSEGEWEGHALAVVGLAMVGPAGQPGPFFIWQNSWGESYGAGGLGYIHHRDLAWLLSQSGEAAIPQGTL